MWSAFNCTDKTVSHIADKHLCRCIGGGACKPFSCQGNWFGKQQIHLEVFLLDVWLAGLCCRDALCWSRCTITTNCATAIWVFTPLMYKIAKYSSNEKSQAFIVSWYQIKEDWVTQHIFSLCRCRWEYHHWNPGEKKQRAEAADQGGLPTGHWKGIRN